MKLTLKNIKELKINATPLEKRVLNYIVDEWRNYDDKKNIFTDVLNYGCQSGMVGFLIYYTDTVRFYNQYKEEIDGLLYELMYETGLYAPSDLFGDKWDKEDPLAAEEIIINRRIVRKINLFIQNRLITKRCKLRPVLSISIQCRIKLFHTLIV